jgi:hypothetical protein
MQRLADIQQAFFIGYLLPIDLDVEQVLHNWSVYPLQKILTLYIFSFSGVK